MTDKIVIVDYGMGNLNSVKYFFDRIKIEVFISSSPSEIQTANKIILPGVGHFKKAMENLKELNLINLLNELVLIKKRPILGICLGMQLMAYKSEEGDAEGFGWIEGEVERFIISDKLKYKIPHMGWNQVVKRKNSNLLKDISDFSEFYFVHSYHFVARDKDDILTESEYENRFTSSVEKGNIYGVQFHPEKSHEIGATLLKNFIEL